METRSGKRCAARADAGTATSSGGEGMVTRGRAQRRERIFSHLSVRVSGMLAALRCGLHQDSLTLSPEDLLDRGLGNRSRRGVHRRPAAGWMQRRARVRRRIERLLRRVTQRRNSNGESISGMSGTDFHAMFFHERPSGRDSLGPTLIGGRGFFFSEPISRERKEN